MTTKKRQEEQADTHRDVLVERRDTTMVARINRPEHGNSVHGTLLRDLLHAFETADGGDSIRTIVTIGEGSTFCVGADRDVLSEVDSESGINFHELGYQGTLGGDWGMPPLSAAQRRSDTLGFGRWVMRVLDVDTPTIAAINGGTAGGGLAVALLHDIRIASKTAKFAPTFIALGVSPEMGVSWLLPRIIGWPKAFDLLTLFARSKRTKRSKSGSLRRSSSPASCSTPRSRARHSSPSFRRSRSGWSSDCYVNRPNPHSIPSSSANGTTRQVFSALRTRAPP